MDKFLAGVGKCLLMRGNDLIGVARTLTDTTFSFSITGDEIRAGSGNALYGKYFHDSSLTVTLSDAMFNLDYIAASLGVSIQSGGLSVYESESAGETVTGGKITLTKTPVAFDGTLIGWYKKSTDEDWSIGQISQTGTTYQMTITNPEVSAKYCIKYFYNNESARSVTIPTQYVPSELHVVILNDLFAGGIGNVSDTPKIGRLITDIPRLQMDGSQNLALSASGAASVSLSGSALAVSSNTTCETEAYYGTMTEEIFGANWKDNVIAIAAENSDITLHTGDTETAVLRVIFSGNMMPARKDNSNFTFTSSASATASVTGGVITAGSTTGTAYITCALTGYADVSPAIIEVTVE